MPGKHEYAPAPTRRQSATRAPFAGAVSYRRRAILARHDRTLRWVRANLRDLGLIAGAIFILVTVPAAMIFGN